MSAEIRTLLQQGQTARREERPQDALRAYESTAAFAKKSGATEELILALTGQGQIERDLGRTSAARTLYREAVDVCRQHGNPLLLAHTVRHLGDIDLDLNRQTEAEPSLREALSLYRSNLKTGVLDLANALRPLALLLERTGRAGEAKEAWEEARVLYKSLNVREGVEGCGKHLAQL